MAEKSYAERDVLDKLDVREGMRIRLVGGVPEALRDRIRSREDVEVEEHPGADDVPTGGEPAHLVLVRISEASVAKRALSRLRKAIAPDGGIWVLTARKGQPDYVQQERLIPLGRAVGLVDNKICRVDETTSAMRFVVPRAQRERPGPKDERV